MLKFPVCHCATSLLLGKLGWLPARPRIACKQLNTRCVSNTQTNLTVLCEPDSITYQIHQNFLQPTNVTDDPLRQLEHDQKIKCEMFFSALTASR
jgi:hypothetical protein